MVQIISSWGFRNPSLCLKHSLGCPLKSPLLTLYRCLDSYMPQKVGFCIHFRAFMHSFVASSSCNFRSLAILVVLSYIAVVYTKSKLAYKFAYLYSIIVRSPGSDMSKLYIFFIFFLLKLSRYLPMISRYIYLETILSRDLSIISRYIYLEITETSRDNLRTFFIYFSFFLMF